MGLAPDIVNRVHADFGEQAGHVIEFLESNGVEDGLARQVVFVAAGDVGRIQDWIRRRDRAYDPRDFIYSIHQALTYDAGLIHVSLLLDQPEKGWACEPTVKMASRGYDLVGLVTRPARIGPFESPSDRGEGVATYRGALGDLNIEKMDRAWRLHGDADRLSLFRLDRWFDDVKSFLDQVSCFVLAEENPR